MAARRLRGCSGGGWRVLTLAMAAVATAIVAVLRLVLSAPLPITSLSDSSLSPVPGAVPNVSLALGLAPRPISSDPPLNFAFATPVASPPPPVLVHLPSGDVNSGSAYSVVKVDSSDQKPRLVEPKEPVQLLTKDRELIYAKREIGRAPLVSDDPELYAPLFRNLSVFKRSYELMEKILKVYIYQEGTRPIFHQPDLKGIYASEGWFMKLMEVNKHYAVKDPRKAHLFYLPYGSRQLELALYVPDSHRMKPLSLFLKNYVNMIAAKYPFWNRTKGSDHFLVACHDWGPYTTKEHNELWKNTIKALCNADVSEDVFIRGKDVSLPETNIRNPRRPLRDIGGNPVSQRSILAFFAGNMHGRVRPVLLKYWGGKDEDMKIYGPLPNRVAKKMSYAQHMKSSKFCICPMGFEVNSPRIVEAIYYECVPVIIADHFVPPFDEVLDWSAFSVIVAENDIPNLKDILLGIPLRKYISMQTNVKRLQKHFMWHARPVKYDLFHMILHSIWFNRLNQIEAPPVDV
ncbi:probable glycosyltransferase At5g03795 [Dioscorea cayenensis subsp. rotundata]|uniref:Probable glycosyltransferase At5g03795 n=1 Tax=Dioscorea cayennensis subsp. rotundata TaxID=55577 RepID=A0AB40CVV0_DIOCR|nr:probable glycosyltransferase At5g03795 [Dioscorea cayenensis subsp. rotundata]